MEVLNAASEAEIFSCVRHVSCRILDADNVFDLCQTRHRCRLYHDIGFGSIVIDDDRQTGFFRNFPVETIYLLLCLTDKHRGQDAQRINAAYVLHHAGDLDRTLGGNVIGSCVDVHSPFHSILRDMEHFFIKAEVKSIKFSGRAEGKYALNTIFGEVVNQVAVCLFVQSTIFCHGGDDRHDNTFRCKHCYYVLSVSSKSFGYQLLTFLARSIRISCHA